jgi:hypothetical protein
LRSEEFRIGLTLLGALDGGSVLADASGSGMVTFESSDVA